MTSRFGVLAIAALAAIAVAACGARERSSDGASPADTSLAAVGAPIESLRAEPEARPDGSLPADRAIIAGLSLSMKSDSVRALLGAPTSQRTPEWSEGVGDTVFVWNYPAVRVEFWGEMLSGLECLDATCTTVDGIHIGSTRDAARAAYGDGTPSVDDPDSRLFPIDDSGCWLRIDFADAKVRALKLECDI